MPDLKDHQHPPHPAVWVYPGGIVSRTPPAGCVLPWVCPRFDAVSECRNIEQSAKPDGGARP